MLTVKNVALDGVGAELGIEIGDQLVSFDGNEFTDVIDYLYFDSLTDTTLTVLSKGQTYECEVEKDEDESFGLAFVEELPTARCCNRCIFCFVDQMPKGMRRTLYVKDDDWRWSLISGNYVTLTNVSEQDLDRILRYRISPLYVSVHAIDPDVRAKLLGNANADVLPKLKAFREAGIRVHAQIVLVPGYNDGAELQKTLTALHDLAASVAVVPVGLTRYRKTPLPEVTAELAGEVIDTVEHFAAWRNADGRTDWVIASDEFYVRAGRPVPDYDTYGTFDQIEDGVGLLAKLTREFELALSRNRTRTTCRTVDLATGWDSYDTLCDLAAKAQARIKGINVRIHRIRNEFFGESITVSGLLTGRDLVAQVKDELVSQELLIPHVMIREGGNVTLDDMTVEDLSMQLGVKVTPVPNDGAAVLGAMLGKSSRTK